MDRREWTKQEIILLKELYPRKLNRDLVAVLNRKAGAIRQKAHRLGITKNAEVCRGIRWIEEPGFLVNVKQKTRYLI